MKYVVTQIGARMHYAVPRICEENGVLSHFFTDACANSRIWNQVRRIPSSLLPKPMRRFLGRNPGSIPCHKITGFHRLGIKKALKGVTPNIYFSHHLAICKKFTALVSQELARHEYSGTYSFGIAGLEIMAQAKAQNKIAVLEQAIAPRRLMYQELAEERQNFPEWSNYTCPQGFKSFNEFIQREEAEWAEADYIICGSNFVVEKIVASGGPREKCIIVPYGVQPSHNRQTPKTRDVKRRLKVLTVGEVGLRKGTQYVYEVAKLTGQIAEFRMVGNVDLPETATKKLAGVCELAGAVPRSEMEKHFEWADLLFLPSLWEGSATVCYEAIVRGLPVICTPNTGSIVENEITGYVIPPRDTEQFTNAIETVASSNGLLSFLSANALACQDATLASYNRRLFIALTNIYSAGTSD